MFKNLFYKKKYIIYFLSVISILLIPTFSAKAFIGYVPTNDIKLYEYNNEILPDVTTIPNFSNYYQFFILYNNANNHYYVGLTKSNVTSFNLYNAGNYCNGDDFPIATRSTCTNTNNVGRYISLGLGNGDYYFWDYNSNSWVLESSNQSRVGIQYWFDVVYLSVNGNVSVNPTKTLSAGFVVNVDLAVTYPSYDLRFNDFMYNSNGVLFYRYRFNVNDYSDDYSYKYRIMDFNGLSYLTDWSDIYFNVGSYGFEMDFYSDCRLLLRILDSNDNVISDTQYVVSGFYNGSLYTQYLLNDSDYFYFISGFGSLSPIQNFFVSFNNPGVNENTRLFDVGLFFYYDYDTGLEYPFDTFHSCVINDINYNFCLDFDLTDIPDYDSNHIYGVKFINPLVYYDWTLSYTIFDSFTQNTFYVLNTKYVSSGGSLSNGVISNINFDYVDANGNVVSSSSFDVASSNYQVLYDSFHNSSTYFFDYFIFFGNCVNVFFSSLSSPLIFCWIFLFSIFIFAFVIKIFF